MLALPAGFVASAVGRRLRVPSVVTCDSGEFVRLDDIGYGAQRSVRQRWAVRAMSRLATHVVVCTEYQARLATACGVRPLILPIGVDVACFHPPAAPLAEGPPWRLLNVGSLNRVKNQQILLAAFARLLSPAWMPLEIAARTRSARMSGERPRDSASAERVTFHGAVPSAALAGLVSSARMCVLRSRHRAARSSHSRRRPRRSIVGTRGSAT